MPERQALVMIVNIDAAVRDAWYFALPLQGLNVRLHHSPKAVLDDPDLASAACLVIEDCPPELDGAELLQRIRARHLAMPAILLTSFLTPLVRERARAAGFSQVIEKPLLQNDLYDAIHEMLRRSISHPG